MLMWKAPDCSPKASRVIQKVRYIHDMLQVNAASESMAEHVVKYYANDSKANATAMYAK